MSEPVSKKTVDEIVKEINQLDINDIELDPKAQKFLKTVQAYLQCFDELETLYEKVDPRHKLANHDMPDFNLPIQQVSRTGEPVKNLSELYEIAESMLPVFVRKVEGLLAQLASSSRESSNIHFKLPPGEDKLKGNERAFEKAHDEYSRVVPGPPESWLYDIVRGSVVFDNPEQLLEFLEVLRTDKSIVIVKSKNRFRNPALSGYRDFNVRIQISDSNENLKHICELQLHINAIKEADTRLKSHEFYEFFRKYYIGATGSLKERMEDLRVICKGGSLDMTFLANVIENPLEVDRMTRLARLFEDYMNEYKLALVITNATRGSLESHSWYRRIASILQSQGKLEEALKMHQEALKLRLEAFGPDHIGVSHAYNNMANILASQGKLDEAMKMHQLSLGNKLKTFGQDHTTVATSYNNMATIQQDQGKLEEAMKMHQKALDIRCKALGPSHIDVAMSYNNMAIILRKQGKLEEARKMHQEALEIRLKVYGSGHTDVAMSYNNIGYILCKQGKDRLQEALEACKKALEIQVKAFGEKHCKTACTLHSIGEILYKLGKLEEAILVGEKALKVFLEVHGPDHPYTAAGRELMDLIHDKSIGGRPEKRRKCE